jgi:hypothetical protein
MGVWEYGSMGVIESDFIIQKQIYTCLELWALGLKLKK